MATINNTQLTVGPGSQSGKSLVTVISTLEFTEADMGNWKVAIKLYGDDRSESSFPFLNTTPLLYTFKFGPSSFLFLKKEFKVIQVTAAGQMAINESREIESGVLDEDPGTSQLNTDPPLPGLPYKDEVFAVVSLTRESTSNVWESFGV